MVVIQLESLIKYTDHDTKKTPSPHWFTSHFARLFAGDSKLDSISSPIAGLMDKDVLDIRDAAKILRCSVDKVRRIPKEDLAVFDGPGRANLYLREHLIEYVQQFRIEPPIDTRCMEEALNDILDQG